MVSIQKELFLNLVHHKKGRVGSFEKTLMLGQIEGKRIRG